MINLKFKESFPTKVEQNASLLLSMSLGPHSMPLLTHKALWGLIAIPRSLWPSYQRDHPFEYICLQLLVCSAFAFFLCGKFFAGISFCRYLLDLNVKEKVAADPEKEALVDQWVEWESLSLQVSFNSCFFYKQL